ncbi:MAG: 4-hydroxy-tetrahydrodipicolinate reductase [Myxococcales bacterium]|nr:4-hydroxy-tetrahydrodipicolinate reductase [Myxococcales bacterium]
MPLRIGVHGATGRMGRLVCEEIAATQGVEIAWASGRALPYFELAGDDADVVIDFSTPEGFARLLAHATCPVVSGTTGMTPPSRPSVPLLHAPNFSLGVAVLRRLVFQAREALPDYDLELVELHHNQKRDAPSGTALRLLEALGPVRNGHDGLRVAGEVGVHAVRGGDIVGEHTVYLCGPGERLELGHVATHRGLFAAGAVRAARWIVGKPAGLYGIEDVLTPPAIPGSGCTSVR